MTYTKQIADFVTGRRTIYMHHIKETNGYSPVSMVKHFVPCIFFKRLFFPRWFRWLSGEGSRK